ncbi:MULTISPECIES: hypothetical protein [Streptomyces]|uniref:hypothetical protein n=1 Tax=Streptomyces TaxID=1883 RepID=UPI001E48B11F|nr:MULTISPECIES: hypothetical protein [Streptomyces]UFQ13982.1 hypothetical protein J2N69_02500 [Streptomyces huasconensis]WCL83583.1 hypothetical protein PPN52_02495 [Streptomyces sp. JCM 35825]
MKATKRDDIPVAIEGDGVELRVQDIGGDMSVAFVRFPEGTDMGPALKGLAGDLCPCPHWGYLFKGRLKMRTPDGDETYEAGDAFYWSPGHAPLALEDCEYIDFSPAKDFDRVVEHIKAQGG